MEVRVRRDESLAEAAADPRSPRGLALVLEVGLRWFGPAAQPLDDHFAFIKHAVHSPFLVFGPNRNNAYLQAGGREEALNEMLRIDPSTRVILTSGFDPKDVAARFSDKQLSFLHKPFRMEDLAEKVREVLER